MLGSVLAIGGVETSQQVSPLRITSRNLGVLSFTLGVLGCFKSYLIQICIGVVCNAHTVVWVLELDLDGGYAEEAGGFSGRTREKNTQMA